MKKLTDKSGNRNCPEFLTKNKDVPFVLCLKYPLKKGYTFSDLSQRDIKDFQHFLDKIAKMTVNQVDLSYGKKPDKNDLYMDKHVFHYEVTDGFRIHVVFDNGYYALVRLDPNHSVHS